ncbi:type I-E CRISPR-associated protein Cse2/CasB [Nocardioides sp. NPDC057764]|uniref:type I-E CRISPR-associated protein Cse2/CasB n=1 Tax=Nocardioides sp. NPDC057764 TaxID=3346243 RepID=UPI00366F361B
MTTETTTPATPPASTRGSTIGRELAAASTAEVLAGYIHERATGLQAGYRSDSPAAAATLARLRRVDPTRPNNEAWDVFDSMPERLLGRGDDPSHAELAATTALVLFAIHQQSRRDAGMHSRRQDDTFGRAAARLKLATGAPGVERRFRAITRAHNLTSAIPHLRGLITQLRGERIPLDYSALARDLYDLQQPARVHNVQMRWTRDYHRPGRRSDVRELIEQEQRATDENPDAPIRPGTKITRPGAASTTTNTSSTNPSSIDISGDQQ